MQAGVLYEDMQEGDLDSSLHALGWPRFPKTSTCRRVSTAVVGMCACRVCAYEPVECAPSGCLRDIISQNSGAVGQPLICD
eukprot:1161894-Pelagomonas_calceolata.AAC.3